MENVAGLDRITGSAGSVSSLSCYPVYPIRIARKCGFVRKPRFTRFLCMSTQSQPAQIEIFFDGECPLCRREIDFLRRFNKRKQVLFTDLSAPDFTLPGKTHDELMAQIHGRLPNGRLIVGVEVFRQVYAALGFKRLAAVSRWLGIRSLLELGYRFFARNRLRWTGRCSSGACDVKQVAS